jgi:hypothetical protein
MAIGTVAYMSPEQALGQTVDPRSDLFSLGAVLYEMVTGERAFPGTTPGAVFDRILNREPRRIRKVDPRVPVELEVVLDRLLAKPPEQRHPSAGELIAELAQVSRLLAAQEPRSSTTSSAAEASSAVWLGAHRRSLGAMALVALAAFLLLAGVLLWKRPRPLSGRDPVLLAGFENKTGEAVFDQTLPYALAVQLGQSPFLNIVTDDRVRETLPLMGRDANERLTPELAREVCQRLATRAMVRGSISRLGALTCCCSRPPSARAAASLARERGEAQSAEHADARPDGDAPAHAGGESIKSVQAFDVPVEQATTPSLEALRSYTLAIEQRRKRRGRGDPVPRARARSRSRLRGAATTLSTVYGNLGEGTKASTTRGSPAPSATA